MKNIFLFLFLVISSKVSLAQNFYFEDQNVNMNVKLSSFASDSIRVDVVIRNKTSSILFIPSIGSSNMFNKTAFVTIGLDQNMNFEFPISLLKVPQNDSIEIHHVFAGKLDSLDSVYGQLNYVEGSKAKKYIEERNGALVIDFRKYFVKMKWYVLHWSL